MICGTVGNAGFIPLINLEKHHTEAMISATIFHVNNYNILHVLDLQTPMTIVVLVPTSPMIYGKHG